MTPTMSRDDDGLASLLIGASPVMVRLRTLIRRIAPSRLPVFITGPTGAGKELAATALHLASGRSGDFVAFNVCAVAETMFEDALFGHRRGSFTGAVANASGYLAEADNGTVFLDEIGGLSLASQAKLLRAIETQTFRSVGATRDTRSNFRVLTASNDDLSLLTESGRFRLDLYHRLAGITLRVPPLTERREDIVILAEAFLRNAHPGRTRKIDGQAMQALMRAEWPGNVRQLKHVVELAATLGDDATISNDVVRTALEMYGVPNAAETRYTERERELLVVMEQTQWSVPTAANKLGVHRATVYRMLARMNGGRTTTQSD